MYDDVLVEEIAEQLYDAGVAVDGYNPAEHFKQSRDYESVFYERYFSRLPEDVQDAYRRQAECNKSL